VASPQVVIGGGALASATLIAITMTRPWLRAVD
jgi:hypothetical protein